MYDSERCMTVKGSISESMTVNGVCEDCESEKCMTMRGIWQWEVM